MYELTKSSEGLRLKAYFDPVGIATIGFGHTGKDFAMGDTCTQAQADAWLLSDMQTAIDAVTRLVTVPLNANQHDALCDFTYNCGQGAFAKSTLLKRVNANDPQASTEFLRWIYASGVALPGLLVRRTAEKTLFDKAIA